MIMIKTRINTGNLNTKWKQETLLLELIIHHKKENDADGQHPLAVKPSLHRVKMLLDECAQHKKQEETPLVGADEGQCIVRGLVVDGHLGPAQPVHDNPHRSKDPCRPTAAHKKSDNGIERIEFQQHKGKPVARFGLVDKAVK